MNLPNKILILFFLYVLSGYKSEGQSLDLITLNESDLMKIKELTLLNTDKRLSDSRAQMIADANNILSKKNTYSVTFNKNLGINSSDNNYMSFGRYLWPNPKTKTGLPYVLKDGHVNKNSDLVSDKKYIDGISNDILILGLAYFYSDDAKYVDWAVHLLNVFFVNERTRMNPNFDFSQVTPGINQSGGSIMEAVVLLDLIDGIQLLSQSQAFDENLKSTLQNWFGNFLFWLENSSKGIENSKHINNRGTYYTALKCSLYLFVDQKDKATDVLRKEAFNRIDKQIAPDGSMPLELKREKPLGYIKYNFVGFKILTNLGNTLGIDLLSYRGAKGQSLEAAIKWFEGFKRGEKEWKYSNEAGVTYSKSRSIKKTGQTNLTVYRFSPDRFDNYIENLTSIK